MATYANQKDIYSQNIDVKHPYIAVSEDDYFEACRILNPRTVQVWMYLIKNKPTYKNEYSPETVSNITGMSKEAAKRAIRELSEKKYLINVENNIWYCYPKPIDELDTKSIEDEDDARYKKYLPSIQKVSSNSQTSIQKVSSIDTKSIEKQSKQSNLYNLSTTKSADAKSADAPEKNRKEDAKLLEDFSKQELWAIQDDFKNEVEYKELHIKYGIDWKCLNKNLGNNIQNILNNIKKEEITRQVFDEFEYMPVYLTPEERESRFLRSRALRKAKEENNDDKAMTAW